MQQETEVRRRKDFPVVKKNIWHKEVGEREHTLYRTTW